MKVILFIIYSISFSQIPFNYKLYQNSDLDRFESISDDGFASNGIIDIRGYENNLLFFGTSGGLSFLEINSFSDIQYGHYNISNLPRGGNPSLMINNNVIAVSGVVDTLTPTGIEPKGTGVSYSRDGGESWFFIAQPIDPIPNDEDNGYQTISWGDQNIQSLSVTTDIDNVCYDLAIGPQYIYTANWAGGIRRYNHLPSEDSKSWGIIPLPQDNDLDLYCGNIDENNYKINPLDPADGGNHNHKGFSVYVIGDTLWAGTAAGINKGIISGDCINWIRHYSSWLDNISGNWVIGFIHQDFDDYTRLWAITWATQFPETNALSYTDNGGETWHISYPLGDNSGKVYNLNVDGDRIWASTELGLYLSENGTNWEKYERPIDSQTGEEILSESMYTSYYSSHHSSLFVGTDDGLAITNNNGIDWTIERFYNSANDQLEENIFSVYPNPFYINDMNKVGNNGHVRFIYLSPSNALGDIDIFDFSMDKVKHLDIAYSIGSDQVESIWNGRNERGDQVVNGVYFCRLNLNDQYYWTKLVVIN